MPWLVREPMTAGVMPVTLSFSNATPSEAFRKVQKMKLHSGPWGKSPTEWLDVRRSWCWSSKISYGIQGFGCTLGHPLSISSHSPMGTGRWTKAGGGLFSPKDPDHHSVHQSQLESSLRGVPGGIRAWSELFRHQSDEGSHPR